MNARRNYRFHSEQSGTALTIQVIPGAEKSRIFKTRSDGCVVVKLAHPNSDARCHHALVDFLAREFSIAPAQIEIIAGDASDHKIVSLIGLDSALADEIIRRSVKQRN